jgi:DNA polymerase-3 subunit epsilon
VQDFAAIDFETANQSRSSVCAVGVVVVRGGKFVDSIYRLIRPSPNYYLDWFTNDIHGISREDTDDAPPFPQVWDEVAPLLAGLPLAAHNAQFDEGCLKAVHKAYGLDYPAYDFRCTCNAARRYFRGSLPNHQLQTVAQACGYDLQQHHHALADAEACAMIALKIL